MFGKFIVRAISVIVCAGAISSCKTSNSNTDDASELRSDWAGGPSKSEGFSAPQLLQCSWKSTQFDLRNKLRTIPPYKATLMTTDDGEILDGEFECKDIAQANQTQNVWQKVAKCTGSNGFVVEFEYMNLPTEEKWQLKLSNRNEKNKGTITLNCGKRPKFL
jgi:hypothetical protein